MLKIKKEWHMKTDSLAQKAYNLRVDVLRATTVAGSGHPTSCLSAADIMAVLFFYTLKFDPKDPKNPSNDRFILSKGHAAPLLFAVYKELGVISEQELLRMRTLDSVLEGHPTTRFAYVDVATGSLGMGLADGVGMALHARRTKKTFYTYVLLGDSELAEGSVWEAAGLAAYYKLNNLVAIVDVNRLGQRGPTMHEHDLKTLERKFESFGWQVYLVDGHDIGQIVVALDQTRGTRAGKPHVILAKTIKGYGVAAVEDKNGYHGKTFTTEQLPEILEQLKKRFWQKSWELEKKVDPVVSQVREKFFPKLVIKPRDYKIGEFVAVREAFGDVLIQAGEHVKNLVCLDAEVSNSTFAQKFAQKFPERFIECFIAEQAMVSIATGLAALGDQVVVSTFGAFLTRAFDQLRMAAISRVPLHVVGTHVGIEIGSDGPSQMALEDLAVFCSLPQSIVLYPCDAVSCQQLFMLGLNYHDGISYLRVARGAAPVIYDSTARFELGGFNVLRSCAHDQAVIIAAGACVHEALAAYEQLKKQKINVAVVDLYSIKPLDAPRLRETVNRAGSRVIIVEDHYSVGGVGAAVCAALVGLPIQYKHLAVSAVPRSGTREQLYACAGIDAQTIVKNVVLEI